MNEEQARSLLELVVRCARALESIAKSLEDPPTQQVEILDENGGVVGDFGGGEQ